MSATVETATSLSRDTLLARGYQEHAPCFPYQSAEAFYQKCVRGVGNEKAYYINLNEYRINGESRWQADLQFYLQDGSAVDVTLHPCNSIEQVERFFEDLFVKMQGLNYDNE